MLPGVGQSSATAFPPPLWGRDRERGRIITASVLYFEVQHMQPAAVLGFVHGPTLCASLPPLSLSLPHKGGGNRGARTFATHAMCPRRASEISLVRPIPSGRARCRLSRQDSA